MKIFLATFLLISFFVCTSTLAEQKSPQQDITFQLVSGSLEDNISALLEAHSDYQLLLWQVSKKHQVLVPAQVSGRNVFHLLDQIISSYSSPKQMTASVYTKNKVVKIHYAEQEIF